MRSALGQVGLPRSHRTSDAWTLVFGGGILAVTVGVLALFFGVLPRPTVVPALATACFILAAIAALAAKLRPEDPRNRVTLWDVAGALTFIGICVSALIEPEQLVQITGSGGQRN